MFRKCISPIVALCLVSMTTLALPENNRDREVRVVTYNMYLGTDFTEIFSATSFPEVISEVAEAYGDVQAGNPAERIDAIANQIAASDAHVVGLQEVALWRTGEFNNPSDATTVSYDFLEMLLGELTERGLHYNVVAVQTNFDAELPAAGPAVFADVRYTDRDVVLVRTDLKTSDIKLEGAQAHTFDTLLTLPLLIGNVTIQRGWVAVDIKMRGNTYRVINAHTEAFHPLVQYAQAGELLQGPANTSLPVILIGDFNSDAEAYGASYALLTGAGFADAWELTNTVGPGYTWPLFLDSATVFTTPVEWLDLVMIRGEVRAAATDRIGEDPVLDVTTSGLRPSDHAGVAAALVLEP